LVCLERRPEPPDERSGEATSPRATLSYYPLPPGTSAASLAAAAGDRMSSEGHFRGRARGSIHLFTMLPRRTEPPDERSGEPTSPTATLSYYPLPPGTSAASLAAAAVDRMSSEAHFRGGVRFISSRRCRAGQSLRMSAQEGRLSLQPQSASAREARGAPAPKAPSSAGPAQRRCARAGDLRE